MPDIVAGKKIRISPKKLGSLVRNYTETARLMDLVYVTDHTPGISKMVKGTSMQYFFNGTRITDKTTLKRIKALVIPPAWKDVWICPDENGHIQVTGIDTKNRKQYRYHPLWTVIRNQTKYYRLRDFGRSIPAIRKRLEHDLALKQLTKNKVLATIVSIMEQTSIRVGNNVYEKLYGSYGLSTLKDQHVHIHGSDMNFSFKGKKGIYHRINMKSRRIANIVRTCKDIPGKELFQYYDENGQRHSIDSGEVNAYIRELSGADFTSKDFRTWAGTLNCLMAFHEIGEADTVTQTKKNIVQALDKVASCLGNTRTVCKKHYVHPIIISFYEEQKLGSYFTSLADNKELRNESREGLTPVEEILLTILEKH
ncbi:MAG: DNA topoisomerase IB [Cytophagales bacterium]|nr:DNA topoisomerase IB [Cytophaga sp.]